MTAKRFFRQRGWAVYSGPSVPGGPASSLSLASGATASTGEVTTNLPSTSQPHELFLGEEEISDVSLSTFYVFDKENAAQPKLGEKVPVQTAGRPLINAEIGVAGFLYLRHIAI